jgi:hypothetical protein
MGRFNAIEPERQPGMGVGAHGDVTDAEVLPESHG